jgi:hypothetical protein
VIHWVDRDGDGCRITLGAELADYLGLPVADEHVGIIVIQRPPARAPRPCYLTRAAAIELYAELGALLDAEVFTREQVGRIVGLIEEEPRTVDEAIELERCARDDDVYDSTYEDLGE